MPMVEIVINGRRHSVQCDDGQETRVKRLGAYIDRRVGELAQGQGQIGDTRLLMLTCLLIADELSDIYDEVKRLRQAGGDSAATSAAGDAATAQAIEQVARRIEAIAERLGAD